jgi:hypothetical protein
MLKLSSQENGHNHIVYLRETVEPESILSTGEGIIGYTSEDQGHQHEVWYSPERAEVDPATGQEVITPSRIYLQEVDGHVHDIEMDYLQVDPSKRDNKEIKNEDKELERLQEYLKIAFQSWENDESYYRPQGYEAEDLYYGGELQWPAEVRKILQDEQRPMLTFNTIKSKVNNIIGMFSANPLMPKIKPTEGSDARLADIYNALNAHLFAKCDFPSVQKEVFTDQVITGRGNIDLKIDTTLNPEGDPMIRHNEWDQVTYMPHNKKDLSDCEGLCQWEWVTKDYLKMIAPDIDLIFALKYLYALSDENESDSFVSLIFVKLTVPILINSTLSRLTSISIEAVAFAPASATAVKKYVRLGPVGALATPTPVVVALTNNGPTLVAAILK